MTSEQEGGCCQGLLVGCVQFRRVEFQGSNTLLCTSVNLFSINHYYNNRTSFVGKGNMLHPTETVQWHQNSTTAATTIESQAMKINLGQPERPMLVFPARSEAAPWLQFVPHILGACPKPV